MNIWTKTQPKRSGVNRKRSWLTVQVRKLRNQVKRFLLGDARPEAEGGDLEEKTSGQPSISEVGGLNLATLSAPQDVVDPIEGWLALIREGAPQLLLPPEEGGTPWQTSSDVLDETVVQPETAAPPARPPEAARFPAPSRATMPESRPDRMAAPEPARLRINKNEATAEPPAPQPARFEMPQAREHLKDLPQHVLKSIEAFVEERSRSGVEARPSGFTEDRPGAVPTQGEMEIERHKFGTSTSIRSIHPALDDAIRNAAEGPPESTGSTLAAALRSSKDAVDGSTGSFRTAQTPVPQPASDNAGYAKTRFVTRKSEEKGPRLPITQSGEYDPSRSVIVPFAPEHENFGSLLEGGLPGPDESREGRRLRTTDLDRWPDLPEEVPLSNLEWIESLASREHIQALDLEQRGGG